MAMGRSCHCNFLSQWGISVSGPAFSTPLCCLPLATHSLMLLGLQLAHTVPYEHFLKVVLSWYGLISGPVCMAWGVGHGLTLRPCLTLRLSSPVQDIFMNIMQPQLRSSFLMGQSLGWDTEKMAQTQLSTTRCTQFTEPPHSNRLPHCHSLS